MNTVMRIYGTVLVLVIMVLGCYSAGWYYVSYPLHERIITAALSSVFCLFMLYLIWRKYIRKWRAK
jgi:hypothetical protein